MMSQAFELNEVNLKCGVFVALTNTVQTFTFGERFYFKRNKNINYKTSGHLESQDMKQLPEYTVVTAS